MDSDMLVLGMKILGMVVNHMQQKATAASQQTSQGQVSQTVKQQVPVNGVQESVNKTPKVDPNMLLGMAVMHMRNMTNISTRW